MLLKNLMNKQKVSVDNFPFIFLVNINIILTNYFELEIYKLKFFSIFFISKISFSWYIQLNYGTIKRTGTTCKKIIL